MSNDPYRRVARWYDAVIEPMNAPLRSIAFEMYPPEAGTAVLDVGCGTGTSLVRYLEAGCRCSGIDLSPAMLEQARRRLGDRADLRLGNAAELPYADGSFGLVLAVTLVHELDSELRRPVLGEIARVLEAGGRALIVDFHPGPLRSPGGRLKRAVSMGTEIVAGRTHFRNFRSFMGAGGLPAVVVDGGLVLEREKIVAGGNVGLYLLKAA